MYVFSNGIITNSSNRISTTTSSSFSGEAHQALKGVSTHHKYFHALNDTIAGISLVRSLRAPLAGMLFIMIESGIVQPTDNVGRLTWQFLLVLGYK